jgi:CheY-like chemotaxis protein
MVPTLLIADDSRTVRTLARQVCLRRGWRLLEAREATEALRLTQVHPVDFILLDTTLRGFAAAEVMDLLRNQSATQTTPIALLAPASGHGGVPPQARSQAHGLLSKPFSRYALDLALQRWLIEARVIERTGTGLALGAEPKPTG